MFTLPSGTYDGDDALIYDSQMATNRCQSPDQCYKLNISSPDTPKTIDLLHRSGGDGNLQSAFPMSNGLLPSPGHTNPRSVPKYDNRHNLAQS